MSDSKPTRLERTGTEAGAQLAILTIDHPPLNLFDSALLDSLAADLAELTANPPRALLLRAEGKVVSGGVDVHIFEGLTAEQGAALWQRLFDGIIHPIE